MVKPRDLDPSKKYPLLMFVYGEPANTTVKDEWPSREGRLFFHRALADAGYVVASVDNRGTPAPKGRDWRKRIHGSVGVLATEEQTAAVRALLAERPYLDPERVASWGWSGGGSMTLNLMFRSPDVYKVGMSVAPVPGPDPVRHGVPGAVHGPARGERRGLPRGLAHLLRRRA